MRYSFLTLRYSLIAGVAAFAALACASVSHSATGGIVFRGSVTRNNSCAINVINDGILGLNGGLSLMSSKIAGGSAAVADIVSTTNYRISAIVTPGFTVSPAGGNTSTTFQARYSGQNINRGRNFAERVGTSRVRLRTGNSTTRVSVHLIATRTGSSFPSGHYEGTVTLRCE
jgi:hypothetical protein